MTGSLLRRPKASRTPSGNEATIPTMANTSVSSTPLHTSSDTSGRNGLSRENPRSRMVIRGRDSNQPITSQRRGLPSALRNTQVSTARSTTMPRLTNTRQASLVG